MRYCLLLWAFLLWGGLPAAVYAVSVPARAHWLEANLLAWKPPAAATQWHLCHDSTAQMYARDGLHRGGRCEPLKPLGLLRSQAQLATRFPHLADYRLFQVPALNTTELEQRMKTQLWAVARNAGQQVLEQSALQLAPLLDRHFTYLGADLGLSFREQRPQFRLWAPTAQQVELELFASGQPHRPVRVQPLQPAEGGTWVLSGEPDWYEQFYRYRVRAYRPDTGRIETHSVTDPWSVSLSADSEHSQIIALSDPRLLPERWTALRLPPLAAPEDAILYELHVRDFSQHDLSVPSELRGKFAAFALPDSHGLQHLRQLAQSGLSHVHLLPIFDFATVPERFAREPRIPEAAADSERPQAAIGLMRDKDRFNWGYDPLHYGVPEGSYARDPQGFARVREFRELVQALAGLGLRTVMDVVYNHTHAAGPQSRATLDKIVPGYFYRLDAEGRVQNTTCCPDTASEHVMMEKLMLDTLLRWAREYKVAGFRFDLMGHHTTENLRRIRQALDALTPEQDGIDGKTILLYGEGWKFGSLDAVRPEQAMNQQVGAGLGVGMFNDRLRDSVRGGNFDHATRADQGFATGLWTDPNHSPFQRDIPAESHAQQALLLNLADNIRVGLAGGLRAYRFENAAGQEVPGQDIRYRGAPGAGYTHDPQENISYVSAHDNYELWDQIAAKAPFETPGREPATASAAERAEMQALALSLPLLGQGIPFLHAGSELLRSKSGDGDSYDSGDWFNLLDWRGVQHGWGLGLPPAWRNAAEWDFWRPRLPRSEFKPTREQILNHLAQIHRLLRLRRSSPLFRLRSAAEIQERVRFLNTGPQQIPGLLAMEISDQLPGWPARDPLRKRLIVLWNAARVSQPLCRPEWASVPWVPLALPGEDPLLEQTLTLQVAGENWVLPPWRAHQTLPVAAEFSAGCFTVPPRAVLVYHERENPQGE